MKIIRNINTMQNLSQVLRKKSKTIGFVPTMGSLHKGHLSLISKSIKDCDVTVVSIYINPLQFGPKEDLKKYPRNFKKDLKLCREIGVDYLFIPSDDQMYPHAYSTTVEVKGLTEVLCGVSRPGYFKGVATIVAKLFNLVCPHIAYFGQKDAQQGIVIKKMVDDLHIPLKIKMLPIVREPDGLAMSSRNIYLSEQEQIDALLLYKSLKKAKALIRSGSRNPAKIISAMKVLISENKSAKIDYIVIVDAEHLVRKKILKGKLLIALAVFIGRVRLIDNVIIKL